MQVCNIDSSEEHCRYPTLELLHQLESVTIHFHKSNVSNTSSQLLSFPSNIKKLTLHKFHLSWEEMMIIGTLQNLEILIFFKKEIIQRQRWDTCEGEFQQLKILKLDGVKISNGMQQMTILPDFND